MCKELEIMKAGRYLLIVIGLVSVLSVGAQSFAQRPTCEFRSTSTMVYSGSSLPQAAITGAYTTYDMPATSGVYRPRRVGENDEFEDEEEPETPDVPFPIGDATWPLLTMLAVYCAVRVYKRRRVSASHVESLNR